MCTGRWSRAQTSSRSRGFEGGRTCSGGAHTGGRVNIDGPELAQCSGEVPNARGEYSGKQAEHTPEEVNVLVTMLAVALAAKNERANARLVRDEEAGQASARAGNVLQTTGSIGISAGSYCFSGSHVRTPARWIYIPGLSARCAGAVGHGHPAGALAIEGGSSSSGSTTSINSSFRRLQRSGGVLEHVTRLTLARQVRQEWQSDGFWVRRGPSQARAL